MRSVRVAVIYLFILIIAATNATQLAASEKPFRIINLNVWSGSDYQGLLKFTPWESPSQMEKRYQVLLAEFKAAKPDVIFIQESSPVDRFTRRLARELNMDEIHQVCIAGIKVFGVGPPLGFKEGNAILARKGLELTKLDDWKLSGSPGIYSEHLSIHFDETVSALLGRINIDGKPVYLICTHLYAGPRDEVPLADSLKAMLDGGEITRYEYELLFKRWQKGIDRRERELGALLDCIHKLSTDIPMIFGGDLNAPPNSSVVQKFIADGRFVNLPLEPNQEAVTWDAINNTNTEYSQRKTDARNLVKDNWYVFNAIAAKLPRRLDYIFLNEKFAGTDSIRSTLMLDNPREDTFASDHYAVRVDLDISKSLEGVPMLYGRPELHKRSQSFLPVLYPINNGVGYGLTAYMLSAFRKNESFELTFDTTTQGDLTGNLTFSVPDFRLRQRRKYGIAFDAVTDYRKSKTSNYFGIGNGSFYGDKEQYERETLDLSFGASRSFSSYLSGQLGFRYRSVKLSAFKTDGVLDAMFSRDSSSRRYSNLYQSVYYDTRDRFSNPTRGVLLMEEIEPVTNYSSIFSDFLDRLQSCNIKYTLLAQSYMVLWYPTTVLALRMKAQHITGTNIPLQSLIPLGGAITLRGSPQDRYLGSVMAVANAELRFPVYNWLGGVVAWDIGRVWDSLNEAGFPGWHANPALGIRIALPDIDMVIPLDLSNYLLRLDVGFGEESTEYFVGFGQAF